MKPILREALRRVRESNDFLLLDCLELVDRHNTDEPCAVATLRWCGHTLLGYRGPNEVADDEEVDCPACEGFCELEARGANGRHYDVECPECRGSGVVDAADYDAHEIAPDMEKLTWRTLNGDPAPIDFRAGDVAPKKYTVQDAKSYIHKAQVELDAPKEQAA